MMTSQRASARAVVQWCVENWKTASVILSAIFVASAWIVHAEDCHQRVQRTLPEINAALDKITDKLEKEDIRKEQTAYLCRLGKIVDREMCAAVGVILPEPE
jgi:hypothetical protein